MQKEKVLCSAIILYVVPYTTSWKMWKTEEHKLAYFLNLMLLFHKISCSQVYFVFPTLTKHCGSHDQCFNKQETQIMDPNRLLAFI